LSLLGGNEDRLTFREEHQRVYTVGQIDEVKLGARLGRVRTRLPDLEPTECAQHDKARRGHVVSRV